MVSFINVVPLLAFISLIQTVNATLDPYEDVSLVTNTIDWPYKASTYGNDSFKKGTRLEGNADSLLLDLINKKNGLEFPKDFIFGVAHSSYQYEGNRRPISDANPEGRGWSLWDVFCEKGSWLNPFGTNINESLPTNQFTTPSGEQAIQGYNPEHYQEDMALAKNLGVKAFRLSISWPRLFPQRGMRTADPNAVHYYQQVLKELKSQGFDVYITLYHWDLPSWLYNFGDPKVPINKKTYGWLDINEAHNNLTLKEYQKYAAACFEAFGNYTPYFATFNEPLTFTNSGLYLGNHAPGKAGFDTLRQMDPTHYGRNAVESDQRINYLMAGTIIKAHFIAYKTFEQFRATITKDNQGKPAMLGLVVNSDWAEPYRIIRAPNGTLKYHPDDILASKRHMDFMLGWWLEPIMFGHWPNTMQRLVANRLPDFDADNSCLNTDGKPVVCRKNSQKLKDYLRDGGALDYITLNHYTGYFVADLDFATSNFSPSAQENTIPPDQYGTSPDRITPGWSTDQHTFVTQFRYQKYGNSGGFASEDKSRVYIIGNAGAQPWLRHTFFSYNKLLLYINNHYLTHARSTKQQVPFSRLGVYLTENGTSLYGESQKPASLQLNDADRVEFIKGNLTAVWLAIQQGVNIKLYTYWSLADNFEWAEGFDSRFGLIWIDYEHNFSRLLKSSYYYYQKVIKKNRVVQ